ncbi:MAG TPA: hypothetical protein VM096_18140 [Vicinamibacterales bacterium]|nr:hypothetical protein [Vicinamibacterales bacterium]
MCARHSAAQGAASPRERRVQKIIQAYSDQGFHRTGTSVDEASAKWLRDQVRQLGLDASLEGFSINRVDPVTAAIVAEGRRIDGEVLFDAAFTEQQGVSGRLGSLESDAPIGVTDVVPNASGAGALGAARKQNRHAAIICVTRGGRAGLCPSNADAFLQPFGPPILQLSDEHATWLLDQARRGAHATVFAYVKRTPATAFNVTTTVTGRDRSLPPLVVMTPRSGWYHCASERGGGIACWLELIRDLRESKPLRDVVFVASSGHELGHLGINAFVDRRAGIVSRSIAWMHFGANIGAADAVAATPATNPATVMPPSASLPQARGNTIQSSDDGMQRVLEAAMASHNLSVGMRMPHDRVPGGEAELIHRGGGRYVSVIGSNLLFHNPADRGSAVSDARIIAHFADAFLGIATALAAMPTLKTG